jgi:hypothetical protein
LLKASRNLAVFDHPRVRFAIDRLTSKVGQLSDTNTLFSFFC